MNNADLILSGEVIEQSCSEDQAAAFRSAIENLMIEDLVAINDYLNAGVAPDSDWQSYWNAFAKFEWKDFSIAYRHVLDRDFSLD